MTMSVQTGAASAPSPAVDRFALLGAGLALAVGTVYLSGSFDLRQAGLFLIAGLLGVSLYHASFGFTGSWRAFIAHRRGAGIRAQMLMLAIATLAFIPLIHIGSPFDRPLGGAVGPAGISVFVGAFIFGLGMQLGGGCGSGTLFAAGGGSRLMLVTLAFFIIGAVAGTAHLPWWLETPSLGAVALADEIGVPATVALQLAVFALIAWGTWTWERRRHGGVAEPAGPGIPLGQRLLRGPWPILWGAVALALLNVATLLVAGHPWSITFGFGLWGAKILAATGVDVAAWEFWTWPYPARALAGSVFGETTSVMNFGLILGAMLAAALAGRFLPPANIVWPQVAAAIIGGLAMGYGARLAFGCNIGAMFGGIASGSLHGWLWLAMAFTGSILGVRLRPLFRLPV
jgi:uncharacterized membrane protein YedE/YeeE